MITSPRQLRIAAFLFVNIVAACGPASERRAQDMRIPPAQPSFTFQNLSHGRIAVYLVEDSRETLLGHISPLQASRFILPDRIFTSGSSLVRIAIVTNQERGAGPTQEGGAIVSVPLPGSSLIGQKWNFNDQFLWRP